MDNEFDFNEEDLGFEDFDDEDFPEAIIRTVILTKNNMIGLLCMKTSDEGGAICRVDPRENLPSVQIYDDPEKAREWFIKSLQTSKRNGWLMAYDGTPLVG